MALTAGFGQYPGAGGERWLMPHMLSMAAGQVGHPVSLLILMISDDRLLHGTQLREQIPILHELVEDGPAP